MQTIFLTGLIRRWSGEKTNVKTEVTRRQSNLIFLKSKYPLPPDTHTYVCVSRSKKCSFFWKFEVLCFLVTSVLRFALLPYHRRIIDLIVNMSKYSKGSNWVSFLLFILILAFHIEMKNRIEYGALLDSFMLYHENCFSNIYAL